MVNGETERGVTLNLDEISFRFQDLHSQAVFKLGIQRTLKVADDGREYDLPAGLGRFPVVPVRECANPTAQMRVRKGVAIPMWPSEAAWLSFEAEYPFLLMIAAGKINAVTGESWQDGINTNNQNFIVVPAQPWLDGFRVDPRTVRQFVATKLGAGATVEEQLTGQAEWGGLQIKVVPMKPAFHWRQIGRERFEAKVRRDMERRLRGDRIGVDEHTPYNEIAFSRSGQADSEMGMAAGGKIRQAIEKDPYGPRAWMEDLSLRCFFHLVDARVWEHVAGRPCPTAPISEDEYRKRGIPWFRHYEAAALTTPTSLAGIRGLDSFNPTSHTVIESEDL